MDRFKVVEIFTSINGEGVKVGQLSVFIRFAGCNMSCNYCDTAWANAKDASFTLMSVDDIYKEIKKTSIKNVTITGGEPLFRNGIKDLLVKLASDGELDVEIETNGGVSLEDFLDIENRPAFTMDYKLPGSGMEKMMILDNLTLVDKKDTVKFVVSDNNDLQRTKQIIEQYGLESKCNVIISPVFGRIEPVKIVDFMLDNKMNNVRMQLQIHKIIWDADKRGV